MYLFPNLWFIVFHCCNQPHTKHVSIAWWRPVRTVVRHIFQLARCGYKLRITAQTSFSPEYIIPRQKLTTSLEQTVKNLYCRTMLCNLTINRFNSNLLTRSAMRT